MVAQTDAEPVAQSARIRWVLDFELIERRLAEQGIAPEAFAEYLGVDKSTLSRLRRHLTSPSTATVLKMSERLDLSPRLLVKAA